jgi:LuxR family transcriptional regulator, maltose regulon positive regulatory protein
MPRRLAPLPAKLTRPRLFNHVARERLYQALDEGRAHPLVWICAPPGSGKTTLAASYVDARQLPTLWYQLDTGDADLAAFLHFLGTARNALKPVPRRPLPTFTLAHLHNLAGFARAYFRAFCADLSSPFVLLLDNYHELPEASPLHPFLGEGLKQFPQHATVVVLSRSDPPKWFAPLLAAQAIAMVGFDALRFSVEEALAFARGASPAVDQSSVVRLHARAEGWAAGLVLLLEYTRRFGPGEAGAQTRSQEGLFHYFATEALASLNEADRDFLLQSAFLPRMTVEMAEAMTDHGQASRLLEALYRRQLFTDRRDIPRATYQYHGLFREFLLERALQDLEPTKVALLQQRAAEIMEANGDFEEAIEIFLAGRQFESAARLMLQEATHFYHTGRRGAFRRWIAALPEETRLGSGWLLYWSGIAQFGVDIQATLQALQGAYVRFVETGDHAGRLRVASAFLLTYFLYDRGNLTAFDRWTIDVQELLIAHAGRIPIEAEYEALYSVVPAIAARWPHSAHAAEFAQRLLELIAGLPEHLDPLRGMATLALFFRWTGDVDRARALPRLAEPWLARPGDALAKVWWWIHHATLRCHLLGACAPVDEAPFDLATALLEAEGLDFALPVLQVYRLGMLASRGDVRAAIELRDRIDRALDPRTKFDRIQLYMIGAHLALLADDAPGAQKSAASGAAMAKESGLANLEASALLVAALAQAQQRSIDRARDCLVEAGRLVDNPFFSFNSGLIAAELALREHATAQAKSLLRVCLATGREQGYRNTWFWMPPMMARLCAHALEHDIEADYVKGLIRQRGLTPPSASTEIWPWPIRLYTLGRFSVVVDDDPLHFQGKTQKRPLELLKAILARGGRGVDQEDLAVFLWPDLDGDAARNAFDLALHRLRKLLGHADAIQVQDGKLELNADLMWVDTWTFERLVTDVQGAVADVSPNGAHVAHGDRVLRLYVGHFLAGEEARWIVPARERLRSKFLRSVAWLTERLEHENNWDAAGSLYRRSVELDPLAEEFHAGLMRCLKKQDRVAEAMDAYRHCRDLLSITLGIEPSPSTKALFRSLTAR